MGLQARVHLACLPALVGVAAMAVDQEEGVALQIVLVLEEAELGIVLGQAALEIVLEPAALEIVQEQAVH